VHVTKVNGKMTSSMARELKSGLRVLNSRASTSRARSKAVVVIFGWTGQRTMESGMKIKSTGAVLINGKMVVVITESGAKMIWKAMATMCMLMVFSTMANTRAIKKKDTENISGLTAASMKVGGTAANSTALAPISTPIEEP